jgi:DNA-binding NarL/FixJ family response regulator
MSLAPARRWVDAYEEDRAELRALVVESRAIVGLGLAALLASEGLHSVLAAPDARAVVALGREVDPQVVLVDLASDACSLDLLRLLAGSMPAADIIVLVERFAERTAFAALAAGAVACIASDAPQDEVVCAIRSVLRKQRFVSPCIARRLALRLRLDCKMGNARVPALTSREREVLALVARGCENAEIGRALHLSPATIKHHVANVCDKLEVDNRLQAAVKAVQEGLLDV